MVLVAAPARAAVWGFAAPADGSVTVCVGGAAAARCVAAAAGDNATWQAILPAGGATSSLSGVLFGSVFVCSGQSNMDFAVPMAFNASAAARDAGNYPDIRVLTIGRAAEPAAVLEPANVTQPWAAASSKTIGGTAPFDWADWEAHVGSVPGGQGFSAVCWFFGREAYKRLNHPVGLIWSSYGGTADGKWMPPNALERCRPGRPSAAGGQWNAMIAPLTRSVISGVVWYQGESNSGSTAAVLAYNCSFP
eukprot:gene10013-7222_t